MSSEASGRLRGAAAPPAAAAKAASQELMQQTLALLPFRLPWKVPPAIMSSLSRLQGLVRQLRSLAGSNDERESSALLGEALHLQSAPAESGSAKERWR